MSLHFPDDMLRAARLGKMCFFSEIQSPSPADCQNCGGTGFLILFIADEGPYRSPAAPYRSDGKTSKWYNDKWWVGESHSFVCPDCKGQGDETKRAVMSIYEPPEDPPFDDPMQEMEQAAFDMGEEFRAIARRLMKGA